MKVKEIVDSIGENRQNRAVYEHLIKYLDDNFLPIDIAESPLTSMPVSNPMGDDTVTIEVMRSVIKELEQVIEIVNEEENKLMQVKIKDKK